MTDQCHESQWERGDFEGYNTAGLPYETLTATTEETRPPKFYCLAHKTEGHYHFIRRNDVIQAWVDPGGLMIEYMQLNMDDKLNHVWESGIEEYPTVGNLDIIVDLWEESGLEADAELLAAMFTTEESEE
jgi:hypothetical protein